MTSALPETVHLNAVPVTFADTSDEADSPRQFEMLANTGAPVGQGFNRMVVNLRGLKVPRGKLPILLQHDPEKRVAFSKQISKKDGEVRIVGTMLMNAIATELVSDMDAGFPMQASIGFGISEAKFVETGDSVEVNGQQFDGPGLVIAKSELLETSFVTNGRDSATNAVVFSSNGGPVSIDKIVSAQFAGNLPDTETEPVSVDPVTLSEESKKDDEMSDSVNALDAIVEVVGSDRLEFAVEQWKAGKNPTEAMAALALVLKEELAAAQSTPRPEKTSWVDQSAQPVDQPVDEGAELKAKWKADRRLRRAFGNDFKRFAAVTAAESAVYETEDGASFNALQRYDAYKLHQVQLQEG